MKDKALFSIVEAERETHLKNVEETLLRIASHKGVVGYFIMDPSSGRLLKRSGFDNDAKEVQRYSTKLKGFIDLAASTVRSIDWKDKMKFLRMSYGVYDVLVAPDPECRYTLVVVQRIE